MQNMLLHLYQKMMIDRLLIKMDSGIYHDPCRYLGEVIRYDRKQQNGRKEARAVSPGFFMCICIHVLLTGPAHRACAHPLRLQIR